MDCSTPGFPVLHCLPESAQTHVHWVSDAIQPSHQVLPPSPRALTLSQHQNSSDSVQGAVWGPNRTKEPAPQCCHPRSVQLPLAALFCLKRREPDDIGIILHQLPQWFPYAELWSGVISITQGGFTSHSFSRGSDLIHLHEALDIGNLKCSLDYSNVQPG